MIVLEKEKKKLMTQNKNSKKFRYQKDNNPKK